MIRKFYKYCICLIDWWTAVAWGMHSAVIASKHVFDSDLLLPPSGGLVCCLLILVFSCWKRLTVPDMGISASALYGPSAAGRKPPCIFRGGKLICGKFKPLCCSHAPHVSLYCTFALPLRQWVDFWLQSKKCASLVLNVCINTQLQVNPVRIYRKIHCSVP